MENYDIWLEKHYHPENFDNEADEIEFQESDPIESRDDL